MNNGIIFIADGAPDQKTLDSLDKVMVDWTMKAARGECAWICADCCCSFMDGMPDECEHGHASCTAIIQRDKKEAQGA